MPAPRRRVAAGASLVELVVALLIFAVGIVAIAALVGYGIRLQATSRDGTIATSLARAQLERLRALPRSAAARQPGGSLTTDEADHSDLPLPQFRRRWSVAAGPAGTQDLVVAVLPEGRNAYFPATQLRLLVR